MKQKHPSAISRDCSELKGFTTVQVIIASILLISIGLIVATTATTNYKFSTYTQKSISAGAIAEAGVNYYLWHLSHNVNDYCDGHSCGTQGADGYGPFTYDYKDSSGKVVGSYSLYVKPPQNYANTVTVKSIGKVNGLNKSRVVQAQLSIPTVASYVLLTSTQAWIGQNETFNGPLHSNIGLRVDSTVNAPVTVAQSTYRPSFQFGGDGSVKPGIWAGVNPQPNKSTWQFPVPSIDFNSVTTNLQQLKTSAQSGGKYLGASGRKGYYLYLKSDNSIDVYKVNTENCNGQHITKSFFSNIPKPANGILFVEDDVWIQSNGTPPNVDKYNSRLTIATGRFPTSNSTNTTITIEGDILYAKKDGSNVIGLIAQKDVKVSRFAPSTLEINAAMLAQTGHVWYNKNTLNNNGNCQTSVKNSISVYGSMATYDYWTWTIVNGSGNTIDGYNTTVNDYDQNLKYNPPPGFPTTTTGNFAILNYRELLENP